MKTTGFRSFVLYILLFAFCGGFVWFLINLALNGSTWATQPYNGHIYGDDTAVSAGTITDRSGMVLAKTEDGSRVYAESEDIRRALLHTVGDSSGYIGTAVQAVHRSQLVGYNPITGLARTVLSDLGNKMPTPAPPRTTPSTAATAPRLSITIRPARYSSRSALPHTTP